MAARPKRASANIVGKARVAAETAAKTAAAAKRAERARKLKEETAGFELEMLVRKGETLADLVRRCGRTDSYEVVVLGALRTEKREVDAATPVEALLEEGQGEEVYVGVSTGEASRARSKRRALSFCCRLERQQGCLTFMRLLDGRETLDRYLAECGNRPYEQYFLSHFVGSRAPLNPKKPVADLLRDFRDYRILGGVRNPPTAKKEWVMTFLGSVQRVRSTD